MEKLKIYVGLGREDVAYNQSDRFVIYVDKCFDHFDLAGKPNVTIIDILGCAWARGGEYKKWLMGAYRNCIEPELKDAVRQNGKDVYPVFENFLCFTTAFAKGIYRGLFVLEDIKEKCGNETGQIEIYYRPAFYDAIKPLESRRNIRLIKEGKEPFFRKPGVLTAYLLGAIAAKTVASLPARILGRKPDSDEYSLMTGFSREVDYKASDSTASVAAPLLIEDINIITSFHGLRLSLSNAISDKSLYRFGGFGSLFRVLKWYLNGQRVWKTNKGRIRGIHYKDIDVTDYMKSIFDLYFKTNFILTLETVELSKNFIDKMKPKAVHLSYFNNPYIPAFHLNRIGTGTKIISTQYELVYPGSEYNLYNEPGFPSDLEYVWNEESKEVLVEYYGYSPQKIKVSGFSRGKAITKKAKAERIVFATQDNLYPLIHFLEAVRRMEKARAKKITIKPHPRHPMDPVNKAVRMFPDLDVEVMDPRSDLYSLLSETKVMVSFNSTVLVDSSYAGVRSIAYDVYGFGSPRAVLPKTTGIAFVDDASLDVLESELSA